MPDLDLLKSVVSKEILRASKFDFDIGEFPISPSETMLFAHQSTYEAQGKSASHLLSAVANLSSLNVSSIMDFPCGHGRVMRAFRANWPEATLYACDLDKRGVDFCRDTFGAIPVYSQPDLSKVVFEGSVDVVWIGSLLTHLAEDEWPMVFDFVQRVLCPGGIVIATYAGAYVAELVRSGDHQFIDEDEAQKGVEQFDESGFGFMQYNTHKLRYGRTLCSPEWVNGFVSGRKEFRPIVHFERGWSGRQSVFGLQLDESFSGIR